MVPSNLGSVSRVYNHYRPGLGCSMPWRGIFPLLVAILMAALPVTGQDSRPQKTPKAPPISKQTREQLIHAFDAELVYVRTNFPMGKTGLTLKNGVVTPNGEELKRLVSLWGPAAKPGDVARISNVDIKGDHIRFEINGGPVKKKKWYEHISVAGSSGATITPSDSSANPRGSFVDLYFDKYVPEMTGPDLKKLLFPVFDFDSKSPLEAYLETVPPKVKDAIKNHQVLVGMNREMVIYSKGRAPKKIREQNEQGEYEDWIYGTPPQDVDFVRFVGDEVVRVETMTVEGRKTVRTEREVDLPQTAVAEKKSEHPANAPTLRRPGEDAPDPDSPTGPSAIPPVAPPPQPTPPSGSPTPN